VCRGTRISRSDPLPRVFVLLSGLALVAAAAMSVAQGQPAGGAASRPATEVAREYQRRFAKLAPDDAKGHYGLAEWCHQQRRYGLLLWQADYVLKLDPEHVEAKLLRSIALRQLKEQGREGLEDPGGAPPRPGGKRILPDELRELFVTQQDVRKLRWAEFRDRPAGDRRLPPDQREGARVKFGKGVLTDFLDAMAGDRDFTGKANRRRFLRLPQMDQLQLIRYYKGDAYADRIEIASNPLVFRKFKDVLPIVQQGCGANNCHGGNVPAKPFGFRNSPLLPELSLYTNFLILDRVRLGKADLVNRTKPEDSLLLQYGLPELFAERMHPTEIKPLFLRGPRDRKYQTVLGWIQSLRDPRPRTGVKLKGYPEPPPPGAAIPRDKPDEKGEKPKEKPGDEP